MRRKTTMAAVLGATLAAVTAIGVRAGGQAHTWEEFGKGGGDYAKVARICQAHAGLAPPAADLPSPSARAGLKSCDSQTLYYGIGRSQDVVRARQCAFIEAGSKDASPLGGNVLLAAVYANGDGVPRNLDLAIHFACADGPEGAAPMEILSRIEFLEAQKEKGAEFERYDACDHATSGYLGGFCSSRAQDLGDVERKKKIAALVGAWPATARAAYPAFAKEEEAYVLAHTGEVDLSGTARASMVIEDETELRDKDLDLLQRLGQPQGFSATPAQLAAADQRLNAAYRKAMTGPWQDYGTVTREDVKKTQREWIKYRDAWLALARAHGADQPTLDGLARTLTDLRRAELAHEEE